MNIVSMNIDDGRVFAEFGCALQEDRGDIHFARSFECSVYLRITVA
jgi:hypothetical protein